MTASSEVQCHIPAFLLTNRCKSISSSLVDSSDFFGSMDVRKSVRNPLSLLVVPSIMSRTIGGIDGGFVPWEKLSNMLKR